MALNLIIADDEYFIRQRIKKIIPWQELDLIFTGEAEDGYEVLELLKNSPVDILILDIKMPRLSGIEVAKQIYTIYPLVHIIVLTGYNDFEFARTALRYGIKDYLLKPVSKEGLTAALKKCIESIQKSRLEAQILQSAKHFQKCNALFNVRIGQMPIDQFFMHYPQHRAYPYALYVGAFIHNNGREIISHLVQSLWDSGFRCEYTRDSDYLYIMQLFLETTDELSLITEFFQGFIEECSEYLFLYVGTPFSLDETWDSYYKLCLHRLTQRYFFSGSHLLLESEYCGKPAQTSDVLKICQAFAVQLNSQDEAALSQQTDQLFDVIRNRSSVDYLNLLLMELFIIYHIRYQIPENTGQHINDFVKAMIDEEYELDSLKGNVIFYGLQCIQKNETQPSDIALSKRVISYIDEHYTQPDLSVSEIGEIFGLHPSYLGSILKKTNHISPLQYITSVRLNAARQMLDTGLYKVSEVAESVGYSDIFYFSKKFKKSFGCSPKDFAHRPKKQ